MLRNGAVRVGVLGQFDKLNDDNTVERAVVGDIPEYEWAGDARIRDIIAGLAQRHPLGCEGGHAFRRPAPPCRPGTPAHRRLGHPGT